MSDGIVLVDPDPRWASLYDSERDLILGCLTQPPICIEHMGSTSVPGLRAKPIIDIIVLVERLDLAEAAVPALVAAGYIHRDDFPMPDRVFLMRRDPHSGERTHQLHLHADPAEVDRHLRFRDRLRADPAACSAYQSLKDDLARRFPTDRMAYSTHKTAFIDAIVAGAGGPDRGQLWNPSDPSARNS